jgi:hypothetical protein
MAQIYALFTGDFGSLITIPEEHVEEYLEFIDQAGSSVEFEGWVQQQRPVTIFAKGAGAIKHAKKQHSARG